MSKTQRREKHKKYRPHAMGLGSVLWLCFLLFAIIIIVFLTLVQVVQYRSQYRKRVMEDLKQACNVLKDEKFPQHTILDLQVGWDMLSVGNTYSVSTYLIATEGAPYIWPYIPDDQQERFSNAYLDLYDYFILTLGKENWTQASEEEKTMTFLEDDFAAYAVVVQIGSGNGGTEGGDWYYLYLYSSFEHLNTMLKDMVINALYSGIFAIALCFIMSGLISMLVSRPVESVTRRAKTLAHGEYNVGDNAHFFLREVNDLSDAINYAGVELSKTDKIQKELIANVSHDFRTPLTMIKAYAAMLQDFSGEDPVKRQKHTQIIIDEADRLAALVRDLLDLSRLQAGVYSFEYTVFNLSEDLYSVAGRFGFLEQTKGYHIKTEIEDDVYTYANKPRAEQVLYNLIGNAVNYTGDDKTVTIRLFRKENCSRFEVIDSGRGIPAEEIPTIWERYYRSSETHKRPVEGTGLGLSIVKNVLKMHGFNFGVESEPGKGSCFWVEFPLPPEKDDEAGDVQ